MGFFSIRNVDLFDGSGFSRNQSVTVKDGRILSVGPDPGPRPGVTVVDGSGCSLLPGLIDSHVHIEGEESLKQSLAFGATTVIDMFCDVRDVPGLRRLARDPSADASDFLTAGTLVTAPGGHGTEYGLTIPTISSPDDAGSFVDARVSEGSDFIKIVYDDGVSAGWPYPTISKATLTAVVRAAHARGKKAVVHSLSLKYASEALESGVDGLVHLFIDSLPGGEFELLLKSRPFVIPTLTVLENACGASGGPALLADSDFGQFLTKSSVASLKKSFRAREGSRVDYAVPRSTIGVLLNNGAPVLAGTDAPNPGTAFGASIHRELELFVESGMTPAEALASATSVPAVVFGMADRGRIVPGARADLLMVRGDPEYNIKQTRQIVTVWKCGREVERHPVPEE